MNTHPTHTQVGGWGLWPSIGVPIGKGDFCCCCCMCVFWCVSDSFGVGVCVVGVFLFLSTYKVLSSAKYLRSLQPQNPCILLGSHLPINQLQKKVWGPEGVSLNCSPPSTSMVALVDHHEIQGKTGFFTLF